MGTSDRPGGRRVLRYLYSTKNLAGSAGALGGLTLFFTGVIGPGLWPLVTAALYGAGALAAPSPAGIDLHSGLDAADLRRAMTEQAGRIDGKVPDDVAAAVARIHESVADVLDRQESLPAGSPDAYVVEQTVREWLPTALESYLRLPRGYANRVSVADGRTPRRVLLDELGLVDAEMRKVVDAVARGDTDRLLAHERFLADRFGAGSDLSLENPPPAAGQDSASGR